MGTDVELLLEPRRDHGRDARRALHAAEAELDRLESLLSRFRPDSELSRLNAAGGGPAGRDLVEVTVTALAARDRTGGRFDPTVHDALVQAGYADTFERVAADGPARPLTARCAGRVEVDVARRRIELGPGVRLDLGGIAKGYAVDRACRILSEAGPCLVNAGGDLAVSGRPRTGVWPVGVETPDGPLTLGLAEGAVATSGRDRRAWRRGGEERHHLIDPASARPSTSDLERVTVLAGTAADAEVLATALFMAGSTAAAAEAEASSIAAVLVTRDARTMLTGALR
ncbi:MAG: FAD:protein FMN transferase [Gaiellales bacterium]